jgi:hypothetical protein
MGAVTYPDPEVERVIREQFVPVQYNVVEQPEVMDQFNGHWTPTLIVQDANGKEHRRAQGYLDPRRFLGEMALARLQDAINESRFEAVPALERDAQERTEGDPIREPEAIYWSSVAEYKASHDANRLLAGWNRLLDEFPQSEWAKRAEFIRY